MNNALGLIGIARRAGKIAFGEDMCSIAVRDNKAKAICTASDASERTIAFAESCGVVHLPLELTKIELGALIGRATCAQLAILDVGIAASVAQKLCLLNPVYQEASDTLAQLDARAKRRKAKKLSRKS